MTVALKKEAFGKNARLVVPIAKGDKLEKRDNSDNEPFLFHEGPQALADDLIMSYSMMAVVGLTTGQGNHAWTCVRERRHFFGVCFTQVHANEVYKHLVTRYLRLMATEGNDHYDKGFAAIYAKTPGLVVPEGPTPKPKAKSKPRKPKPAAPAENQEEEKTKPAAMGKGKSKARPKPKQKTKGQILKEIADLENGQGEGNDEEEEQEDDEEEQGGSDDDACE